MLLLLSLIDDGTTLRFSLQMMVLGDATIDTRNTLILAYYFVVELFALELVTLHIDLLFNGL